MKMTMKKEENLIELSKKYFWEQKLKELGWALAIIFGLLSLISLCYILGNIFPCYKIDNNRPVNGTIIFSDEICSKHSDYAIMGLLYLAGIAFCLILLATICVLIYMFIHSNTIKARKKALIKIHGEEYIKNLINKKYRESEHLYKSAAEEEVINSFFKKQHKQWEEY
jgi:protein-S-isoprenylcysteine O-methyltransferase Ste14